MARLSEQLGDFLSRVELLARGSEWQRQEAVQALAENRPWDARHHALAILAELPRSRAALALWADAAETMWLDHEAVEALSQLAETLPFRADVWLRMAQAEWRLGRDPRASLERASEAPEPVQAADAARLWLAELDLLAHDADRAERWLGQLSLGARQSPEAVRMRVQVLLALGDRVRAAELAERLPEPAILDARGWLVRGRLLADEQPLAAAEALERALLLDAPGAEDVIAEIALGSESRTLVDRMAELVRELGRGSDPRWRATFALADGRTAHALDALAEAVRRDPKPELVARLIALAIEARDVERLIAAVKLGHHVEAGERALVRALAESGRACLDALDSATGSAAAWAAELRSEVFRGWLGGSTVWSEVLAEIGHQARSLGALEALQSAEVIALDLERPLRVAVVGEFNAGKSSFINALLGQAVAPVGVLPTTATLNRLVWAPDAFVRIELSGADDRLVPHADLKRALSEVELASVERVTICAPLEPLRRLEIIDTPGFNAPDTRHAETARAAFDEAHVALWLLDASQPLKDSERAVLQELAARGLPLLVLVNKLDRVGADALAETIQHVERGLSEAALTTLAPPLALSARLALAGRAGDPAALAASRWAEVEALIEHVLVNESGALRERVLRRRAADVVRRLGAIAAEQAAARRAEAARLAERAERLRRAADGARADGARLARELEKTLVELLEETGRDLRPVSGASADPAARRFAARRLRAIAAPALAARAAELSAVGDSEASGVLSAALGPRYGAVCAAVAPFLVFEPDAERRQRLREELSQQLVEELALAADEAAVGPAPSAGSPLELRAGALLAALETPVTGINQS